MKNQYKILNVFKIYLFLITIFLAFLFGILVGVFRTSSLYFPSIISVLNKSSRELVDKKIDFDIFWQAWNIIQTKYVHRTVDEKTLFYGAMSGLAASLQDPNTVFFDPDMTKEFNNEITGTFEGIGVEIGIKKDQLVVIAPLPDSPAEKAGILAGDRILEIDGKITTGMSSDAAVSMIRGKEGTKVNLLISRANVEEPLVFSIVREVIKVQSVTWRMTGERFAYIQLSRFFEDTASNFQNITRQIVLQEPRGIILDLRNNPGGVIDSAIKVSSLFVPKDQVIVIEDFGEGKRNEYKSEGTSDLGKYPIVVLVNEGSASASEIVAGALQDYGLAQVVGKQTFGKGSVQELEPFSDGSSLKLTVALWLTPKGRSINEEGIKPDVETNLTKEDYDNNRDPQLDKTIEILLEKTKAP